MRLWWGLQGLMSHNEQFWAHSTYLSHARCCYYLHIIINNSLTRAWSSRKGGINQCFSNFSVGKNHLESWQNRFLSHQPPPPPNQRFRFPGSVSNKVSGAAGPRTTLWAALVWTTEQRHPSCDRHSEVLECELLSSPPHRIMGLLPDCSSHSIRPQN